MNLINTDSFKVTDPMRIKNKFNSLKNETGFLTFKFCGSHAAKKDHCAAIECKKCFIKKRLIKWFKSGRY